MRNLFVSLSAVSATLIIMVTGIVAQSFGNDNISDAEKFADNQHNLARYFSSHSPSAVAWREENSLDNWGDLFEAPGAGPDPEPEPTAPLTLEQRNAELRANRQALNQRMGDLDRAVVEDRRQVNRNTAQTMRDRKTKFSEDLKELNEAMKRDTIEIWRSHGEQIREINNDDRRVRAAFRSAHQADSASIEERFKNSPRVTRRPNPAAPAAPAPEPIGSALIEGQIIIQFDGSQGER
ncbi:MAG: hypothetical protein FWD33_01510 [Alphaproteobacteria bacterium]|nr:hypothetical protein [Alphaproteobacteria bacterium]